MSSAGILSLFTDQAETRKIILYSSPVSLTEGPQKEAWDFLPWKPWGKNPSASSTFEPIPKQADTHHSVHHQGSLQFWMMGNRSRLGSGSPKPWVYYVAVPSCLWMAPHGAGDIWHLREEDPQGDTCIMFLPWILPSWHDGGDNGNGHWLSNYPEIHVHNNCYISEAVEESTT